VTAAESDQRLFAELWISLVSLVRSYVAGHDLGRPSGHATVDCEEGRLKIRAGKKLLTVEFDSASGKGKWNLYEASAPERGLAGGEFEFSADSTVRLSDRRGAVEMEIAAEAFTARVFEED
jgi:hypothetical protein